MAITPEQIKLVSDSWRKVVPISSTAAELFYNKLFELNPEYKKLFSGDMQEQGRKLMSMINMAATSLDNLEVMIPALKNLGARHIDYGVVEEDYAVAAEALLWTLEKGLGDEFTPEVKLAWVEVYTVLYGIMMEGVQEAKEA